MKSFTVTLGGFAEGEIRDLFHYTLLDLSRLSRNYTTYLLVLCALFREPQIQKLMILLATKLYMKISLLSLRLLVTAS